MLKTKTQYFHPVIPRKNRNLRIVLYIHILTIPGEANKIMSQLEWKQKILIKA